MSFARLRNQEGTIQTSAFNSLCIYFRIYIIGKISKLKLLTGFPSSIVLTLQIIRKSCLGRSYQRNPNHRGKNLASLGLNLSIYSYDHDVWSMMETNI